jgi:hypothetical protein
VETHVREACVFIRAYIDITLCERLEHSGPIQAIQTLAKQAQVEHFGFVQQKIAPD